MLTPEYHDVDVSFLLLILTLFCLEHCRNLQEWNISQH